ncbi:substrate-binding domain-containing protein [Microbacterium aquimaris]|uniref:Substrate-binding domain-containing protein n=1 Tax=Microbacterium aquimaris TaxID=459816 RepID=A0ABU5N5F7_9MICO|nr:substrate-binding domain-containing protein [Microbacterium aquimaris]MDZ8161317.1 substrate-binding domain-containing protein [Microbacterium aquimaris]
MKIKHTRRSVAAATIGIAALAAAGCTTVGAGDGGDAGSGDDDGKYRIVTVSKVEGITWFQRMSEGVDMFNDEYSDEVEAYQTGPDSGDPAQQVQIVEDLIAQQVDAIIVVPNDVLGIAPVLERAREAGIIVGVTEATQLVGTDSIDYDVEAFYNAEFGAGFGQQLTEAMNCEGEYATSVGLLTSESHMEWLAAANEYIAENCPDMVNVSPTPYENENDDQVSRDLAEEILSAYPDLGGYLATTPSGGSGMASALRDKGRQDVQVVALTLPSVAGPDLEEGYMFAGQGWDPAGWGWALNDVALRMLKGEDVTTGTDLGWPGYEEVVVDGQLIIGNDIQQYYPGDFADGDYPF